MAFVGAMGKTRKNPTQDTRNVFFCKAKGDMEKKAKKSPLPYMGKGLSMVSSVKFWQEKKSSRPCHVVKRRVYA